MSACTDDVRADGEPCVSAFACASGACLALSSGPRVCARRCASNADCNAGDVCGRYDFRGRDDSGIPKGPLVDVVRVCRAPLGARCDAGCDGRCAAPCDHSDDCAANERCDTSVTDTGGHGACRALDDGGVAKGDAAHCDAEP